MEGIPLGIPAEERNISNGLKSSLHVSHDNLDKGGGDAGPAAGEAGRGVS